MATAFTEIAAGLNDAIAHAATDTAQDQSGVILHTPQPLDVKAIRRKTGLSQQQFCATFGISLGTLRNWEQGLRTPHGPARVLLKVVDRNPKAVIETLADGEL